MNSFHIDLNDIPNEQTSEITERIRICMELLINRFNIRNKSILSLGGGICAEERHFQRAENRVTIIDIDESGSLNGLLTTLNEGPSEYIIADATSQVLQKSKKYDLLFLSSFTPDELRRDQVLRNPDEITKKQMSDLNFGNYEWPIWIAAFHPSVYTYLRHIKDDGRLIIQSYAGGMDVTYHRYYLTIVRNDFKNYGLILEEVYRLENQPGVMMYVARKHKTKSPSHFPSTGFHGRFKTSNVQTLYLENLPKVNLNISKNE